MKKFYEILIISIIFITICFVYKGQQRITVNGGKGWDGVFYYGLTEQLKAGTSPVAGDLPFIKRLGTPILVAAFSKYSGYDILESALYVNLLGAFIAVILLLLWLRSFIREFWINGLLCFLFMMGWYLPLRFSFYYPMAADAWGAVWFLAALLTYNAMKNSFDNRKHGSFTRFAILFAIVVAIGNLFRESNSILCLLPFFILNPFSGIKISSENLTISHGLNTMTKIIKLYLNRQTLLLLLPAILVFISNGIVRKLTVVTTELGYSYIQNILSWLYLKTLPEYLLGIFISYGPVIVLLPFFWREIRAFLMQRQELLFLLILSFVFGLIGGSDTERIFFMSGFPVVYILLGLAFRNIFNSSQRWWLWVLLPLQSVSYRFFWSLPDYSTVKLHTPIPFFGLIGNHFQYHYLYSHFSNNILSTLLLIEYLLLFLMTWYVIHNKIDLKGARESSRLG
jgi:hypothetical protein